MTAPAAPTAPTAPAAIRASGVHLAFGETEVLHGVDLEVAAGSIFALLGPNGAGKTTMVRLLTTLIEPDAGELSVLGHDVVAEPDAVRALIGVTGQFAAVDELLTGRENLRLMADLHHLPRSDRAPRVDELLARLDLVDAADRPAATYSGGMRRRLDLAMTLTGSPRVIFLDEPTTGLDPRSRRAIWDGVRELAAQGITIFLTTQYLEEADELADRVVVLDGGRVVAAGSPAELKREVGGGHIALRMPDAGSLAAVTRLLGTGACDEQSLTVTVAGDGSVAGLRALLHRLDDADIDVAHLEIHSPDLDDVFLAVTGQQTGPGPGHEHGGST